MGIRNTSSLFYSILGRVMINEGSWRHGKELGRGLCPSKAGLSHQPWLVSSMQEGLLVKPVSLTCESDF